MKSIIVSLIAFISIFSIVGTGFAQTLDEQTQQALIAGLNDEYNARATYQKVLDQFGNIRPFTNIIRAEEQHIQFLLPLFQKYGVAVPTDTAKSNVPDFASAQDALKAAVDAEIQNAQLYDRFFSFIKEADIVAVFTELRNASQNNHLPAFQRALERTDGQQSGQGRGQGGQGRGQGARNSQ